MMMATGNALDLAMPGNDGAETVRRAILWNVLVPLARPGMIAWRIPIED